MDRLLIGLVLVLLMMLVPVASGSDAESADQAVFFSMLFPQLMPSCGEATPGEAVLL